MPYVPYVTVDLIYISRVKRVIKEALLFNKQLHLSYDDTTRLLDLLVQEQIIVLHHNSTHISLGSPMEEV